MYDSAVKSRMLHGSEKWPVTKENEQALERARMRMVWWMCGTKLIDKISSAELTSKLGIEDIRTVVQRRQLRWFGHVQ